MQELYYNAASSSATLVKEDKSTVQWNNVLNVSLNSDKNQIEVTDGSTYALLSLNNTNLLYTEYLPTASTIQTSTPPLIPLDSGSYSTLNYYYLPSPYLPSDITSQSYFTLLAGTSSLASGSGSFNLVGTVNVPSDQTYSLTLAGTGAYWAYVSVDNPQIPSLFFNSITSSSGYNTPASTSFVPQSNTIYDLYFMVNPNAPYITFQVEVSSSYSGNFFYSLVTGSTVLYGGTASVPGVTTFPTLALIPYSTYTLSITGSTSPYTTSIELISTSTSPGPQSRLFMAQPTYIYTLTASIWS